MLHRTFLRCGCGGLLEAVIVTLGVASFSFKFISIVTPRGYVTGEKGSATKPLNACAYEKSASQQPRIWQPTQKWSSPRFLSFAWPSEEQERSPCLCPSGIYFHDFLQAPDHFVHLHDRLLTIVVQLGCVLVPKGLGEQRLDINDMARETLDVHARIC